MNKLVLLLLISTNALFAQTKVYFFPGQGSDKRLFDKIKLDSSFESQFIEYPIPKKGESLPQFAKELSLKIDTTQSFILIGVSLGGMICTELSDFLKPVKTIVISSAKCRQELPKRYTFQRKVPINRAIPAKAVYLGAKFLQPIVEPDRNKQKSIFKAMLSANSPIYLKRTANMIINWNRNSFSNKIIHIHGTNDHTLPLKHIKANYIIKNGSHMMTLTKGEEINEIIKQMLNE